MILLDQTRSTIFLSGSTEFNGDQGQVLKKCMRMARLLFSRHGLRIAPATKALAIDNKRHFEATFIFSVDLHRRMSASFQIPIRPLLFDFHRAIMDYVQDLKTSFFTSEKVGTIEFSQPTLYSEEQPKTRSICPY